MRYGKYRVRKLRISRYFIKFRGILFSNVYLPKINPNIISFFTVLSSMIFILALNFNTIFSLFLLFFIIILDGLDGEIARRYKINKKEEGYIIDVTCDRISESLISIPFFFPWFFIFTINLFLTLLSFNKKFHIILPLRHIFLLYFIISHIL